MYLYSNGYLEAAIEANVVGWIGFGISANGYMDSVRYICI